MAQPISSALVATLVLLSSCAAQNSSQPAATIESPTTTREEPRKPTTTRVTPTTYRRSLKIGMECPPWSAESTPYRAEFQFSISELEEFASAIIDYGDGKGYSSPSLADAEQNMFWHNYAEPGYYTVSVLVTNTNDLEFTADCSFSFRKAPAATSTTAQPTPTPSPRCDPNYSGCVPIDSDVDCAGGSGNGPSYARGPVQVIGRDIYGLDGDNDGIGCE